MDEWLKKYTEIIDAAGDSVYYFGLDSKMPRKAGELKLVVADFGIRRFSNTDTFETTQQLHHIIAPNGHLIVRLKSMHDPKYHIMEKVANDFGFVMNEYGKIDCYFNEAQVEDIFGPFFRVDNLCEELLDEEQHNRFVFVGCFERI